MLKTMILILAGLIPTETSGLSPELEPPVRLEAAGKPIDTDTGHAAPFVCDFDGDGIMDLLVGQLKDGILWIYHNEGTNSQPKLEAGVKFKNGNMNGCVPGGYCIGFGPNFVDINHDDHMDIISGSWPGEIFLFKGGPDYTFAAREMIKDKDGNIINIGGGIEKGPDGKIRVTGTAKFEKTDEGSFVDYHGKKIKCPPNKMVSVTGSASAVHVVDWDSDGDFDLIIGTVHGEVYVVPNEGTQEYYAFGKEKQIASVKRWAGPFAADWDSDGDLDLLVGAKDGSVSLFENTGSATSPELASAIQIVPPGEKTSGTNYPKDVRRGGCSKICVADWNGDGRLDLFVGDYYRQKSNIPEPSAEEKAEQDKIRKELDTLRNRFGELAWRMHNASPTTTKEEFDKISKEIEEIRGPIKDLESKLPPEYEYHGWIWLFLRKEISPNDIQLETIREKVIQNEGLYSLIKLDYVRKQSTSIPESELLVPTSPVAPTKAGRRGSYCRSTWAKDGIKQYLLNEVYSDSDELVFGHLSVLDGKVLKMGMTPGLMDGNITKLEDFQWALFDVGFLGLRPFNGKHKLSELLVKEHASFEGEIEVIDKRKAYVVGIKKPGKTSFTRMWIDCERGMPIKYEHYDRHPDSSGARLTSEVKSIELHQLPNGGWFPVKGTRMLYRRSQKSHILFHYITVEVNSITINREDIPDSLFDIDFPVGAQVYNAITGVKTIVTPTLSGKSLPDMKDFGINLSPADVNNKSMLVCFFDMEQRPSRNCILQISKKAKEIKEKGIYTIAVQASKIERSKLDEWKKENNISFPVGMIEGDSEKTRSEWGVKSLPWLILTDKKHVVVAEGFSIDELDEKIEGK